MPWQKNEQNLRIRLQKGNQNLDALFISLENDRKLQRQIQQIKLFYQSSFLNALTFRGKIAVLKEYEQLISILNQVKTGEMPAEHALNSVNKMAAHRKADIIFVNLIKVCELIFWTFTASFAFLASINVGLPLLVTDPINGLTVITGTQTLMFHAINKALTCFKEFSSFKHPDSEEHRERNLISFFNAPRPQPQVFPQTDADLRDVSITVSP